MLFRAESVTAWTEMITRVFTDFGSSEFMQAVVGCGMDIHDFYIVGIGAAAKETLFALSTMIDRIPKKQEKLRKKILFLQQKITTALDMDD